MTALDEAPEIPKLPESLQRWANLCDQSVAREEAGASKEELDALYEGIEAAWLDAPFFDRRLFDARALKIIGKEAFAPLLARLKGKGAR